MAGTDELDGRKRGVRAPKEQGAKKGWEGPRLLFKGKSCPPPSYNFLNRHERRCLINTSKSKN